MARSSTDKLVALTTVGSEEQAISIAEALVDRKQAACVNIQPSIRSIYRWKGKIWDDEEFLLLIKTTRARFGAVRETVKELHSYELPEVLALPVAEGDPAALDWIEQSVQAGPRTADKEDSATGSHRPLPSHLAMSTSPSPAAGPVGPSRLALLGQFALIPLIIVVVGVAVFVLFGMVASEERSTTDYLREIRTGHANRRWQAAFELARHLQRAGGSTDARVVDKVLDTFEWARDEDPQVRRYLAQALGILQDPRAVPALVQALDDQDADTRLWSVNALGAIGDPTVWESLLPVLGDADPAVRKQAAHSLAVLGAQGAADRLLALLQDPVTDVRWNAALSLAWLDDARGVPVLLTMLDRRQLGEVRALRPDQAERAMVSALEALERLRPDGVRDTVQRLADNDESLRVRQAALGALEALDTVD